MFFQTWLIRVDKMVGTFIPKYTCTKRGIYYFCKDVLTLPPELDHQLDGNLISIFMPPALQIVVVVACLESCAASLRCSAVAIR